MVTIWTSFWYLLNKVIADKDQKLYLTYDSKVFEYIYSRHRSYLQNEKRRKKTPASMLLGPVIVFLALNPSDSLDSGLNPQPFTVDLLFDHSTQIKHFPKRL